MEEAHPTKEILLAVLKCEITYAYEQCRLYAPAAAIAAVKQAQGDDDARPDIDNVLALKWAWRRERFQELLGRALLLTHDYAPDLLAEMDRVGLDSEFYTWLRKSDRQDDARDEREALDATRCNVVAGNVGDGTNLTAWRALSDDEKRAQVACWHRRQGFTVARPRELAQGAQWPTSTFDDVPWETDARLAPNGALPGGPLPPEATDQVPGPGFVHSSMEPNADEPFEKYRVAVTRIMHELVFKGVTAPFANGGSGTGVTVSAGPGGSNPPLPPGPIPEFRITGSVGEDRAKKP